MSIHSMEFDKQPLAKTVCHADELNTVDWNVHFYNVSKLFFVFIPFKLKKKNKTNLIRENSRTALNILFLLTKAH